MNKLTRKQIAFLNDVTGGKNNWTFNPDTGLVDVSANVRIPRNSIYPKTLPVKFGRVDGYIVAEIYCLTSLIGFPYYVGDSVWIYGNHITSLDWSPEYLGGKLYIDLGDIKKTHRYEIITQLEPLRLNGKIKIYKEEQFYVPYLEDYEQDYNRKLIELI